MKYQGIMGIGFLILIGLGCTDRLAQMQNTCQGTWELALRQLPNGTELRPPQIQGGMCWIPLDSRKAHVTIYVQVEATEKTPRRFDYAASTYELSTSAITRKRHLLLRQGYRSSATMPLAVYGREKKAKGKISVGDGTIRISHTFDDRGRGSEKEEYDQVFAGNTMTISYTDAFTDTWRKERSP